MNGVELDMVAASILAELNTSPGLVRDDAAARLRVGIDSVLAHGRRWPAWSRQSRNPSDRGVLAAREHGVEVVPLVGLLFHRGSILDGALGICSLAAFAQRIRQLSASPGVRTIVLDVDSPGGIYGGVLEAAAAIANSPKRIVAVANGTAVCSAYWIASRANEVVVTPSGTVGGIGAYMAHVDVSRALELNGKRVTLIRAGRFKVEGSPFGPLPDSAREWMQQRVDQVHAEFVSTVAAGRRVSRDVVRRSFGEGRYVPAARAVDNGMADRVATFDEVLAKETAFASGPERTVFAHRGASVPLNRLDRFPFDPLRNRDHDGNQ